MNREMSGQLDEHIKKALSDREFALDFYNGKYTEENLREKIPDRYKRQRILDLYKKFLGNALRPLLVEVTTSEIQNRIAKEVGINNFSEIKTRLENGESVQDLISEHNLHALLEILEEETVRRRREGHDLIVDQVSSEKKGLEDEIFEQAVNFFTVEEEKYFDKLTGIYSLEGLQRDYQREVDDFGTYKENEVLAFVSFDIDDFKKVNDLLTHDGADEVLKELASRLSNILRTSDKVGRRSGDEFVVLAKTSRNGINDLLDKINIATQEPFRVKVDEEEKEINISITGSVCLIDKNNVADTNYKYWSIKSDEVAKHGKIFKKGDILIDSPDLMKDLDELDEKGVREYFEAIITDNHNRAENELEVKFAGVTEGTPKYDILVRLREALKQEFEGKVERRVLEYYLNKIEREESKVV